MKAELVPTDEYYHRIIEAPVAERAALYHELFVQPWASMMRMVQSHLPDDQKDDPLAAARAWHWLLPDEIDTMQQLLHRMEAADAWTAGRDALNKAAAQFAPYTDRIGFDTVTGWLVLANPATSDKLTRGYTGAIDWSQPRFVGQFDKPNETNLPRIPGLVAHEMHHLVRLRAFPWGPQTTVADYIVLEGMAEAFAESLFGEDAITFFATEITGDELTKAREIMGGALQIAGFNEIRAYIFGDGWVDEFGVPPTGMPTYGGYAVGYRAVKAFLERTGTSVVDATFLPADEIVARSGYFE